MGECGYHLDGEVVVAIAHASVRERVEESNDGARDEGCRAREVVGIRPRLSIRMLH